MDWEHKVGVIGGGSWGTAIAHLAGLNGFKVFLWLRDETIAHEINEKHTNIKYTENLALSENIQATSDLEKVVKTCQKFKITASICGQAPSEYDELVEFLVSLGITSISVNPDAIDRARQLVYYHEERLVNK